MAFMNTSRSFPLKQNGLWVGGDGSTRYRAGYGPDGGTCRGSGREHAVNEGGDTGYIRFSSFYVRDGDFFVS